MTTNKRTPLLDSQGRDFFLDAIAYNCACCHSAHWLEPGDELGFICAECYWEDDPTDSEYGPNSTSLAQARKNYLTYRACDPHGYWCKNLRELPPEVADETSPARLVWLMASYCPDCGDYTGFRVPCPAC